MVIIDRDFRLGWLLVKLSKSLSLPAAGGTSPGADRDSAAAIVATPSRSRTAPVNNGIIVLRCVGSLAMLLVSTVSSPRTRSFFMGCYLTENFGRLAF